MEGLTGSILKKIFKNQLIIEIHGDWERGPFLSKKRRFKFFQKKVVPILARFSLKSADKIRAISSFTKKEAIKLSGIKPYFVFPTFTDINAFLEEKETVFENFILFVGGLEKVKGVKYLIKAFSKVKQEFPQFKLVIIGKGSEKENLESEIRSLNIEDKVKFKGRLSLEETKNIMKNCYCLVLPSLSEGLGRVLMESMALGKPVVASRVGGIPDLIKDNENGFLFEKGNSNELAEKLRILLNNRNLTIKMGQKGREFVRVNFSNEKYIKSYISMINA